jgi:hypothetical protein
MVRLYRAETSDPAGSPSPAASWMDTHQEVREQREAYGRWFSATLEEAIYYRTHFGEGRPITFVDVPVGSVESWRASNQPAGSWSSGGRQGDMAKREYFIPKEVASERRPLYPQPPHVPLQQKPDDPALRDRNAALLASIMHGPSAKPEAMARAISARAVAVNECGVSAPIVS